MLEASALRKHRCCIRSSYSSPPELSSDILPSLRHREFRHSANWWQQLHSEVGTEQNGRTIRYKLYRACRSRWSIHTDQKRVSVNTYRNAYTRRQLCRKIDHSRHQKSSLQNQICPGLGTSSMWRRGSDAKQLSMKRADFASVNRSDFAIYIATRLDLKHAASGSVLCQQFYHFKNQSMLQLLA